MRMAGNVSLKKVAERTGLAVSTVSEILNGHANNYSSEATKQRVTRVAKELGYQPNFGYKLMQGHKTQTVAILNSMPRMNNEENTLHLILRMIPEFDRLGYAAYCSTFSDNDAGNLNKIRVLIGRGVEHFVFLGSPIGHEAIIKEIEQHDLSYVSTSGNFSRCVNNGYMIGSAAMFSYIKKQVGKNFKLVCQEKDLHMGSRRIDGLQLTFPELSLDQINSELIYTFPDIKFDIGDYRENAYNTGYNIARELLQKYPDLGCINFSNDLFAVGGGGFLMETGNEHLRNKILLCGYNNDNILNNFPLPISSVGSDIARQAELLVINALKKGPLQETVYPKLHIRKASSSPRYPHWDETVVEWTTDLLEKM